MNLRGSWEDMRRAGIRRGRTGDKENTILVYRILQKLKETGEPCFYSLPLGQVPFYSFNATHGIRQRKMLRIEGRFF